MQVLSGNTLCAMLLGRQLLSSEFERRAHFLSGCDGDEDSAEETIIVD